MEPCHNTFQLIGIAQTRSYLLRHRQRNGPVEAPIQCFANLVKELSKRHHLSEHVCSIPLWSSCQKHGFNPPPEYTASQGTTSQAELVISPGPVLEHRQIAVLCTWLNACQAFKAYVQSLGGTHAMSRLEVHGHFLLQPVMKKPSDRTPEHESPDHSCTQRFTTVGQQVLSHRIPDNRSL